MTPIRLITFSGSRVEKVGRSQGKAVLCTAEGDNDGDFDAELWGTHGIVSRPSKTTRGIRLRIGNLAIVIGAYTYGVEPPVNQGASKLYGTDANGVEKSSVLLDSDGVVTVNDGEELAARKGDSVQLSMSATDIQSLAVALLATGGFTPSGSPPTAGTQTVFTGGEITSGTNEVLLP